MSTNLRTIVSAVVAIFNADTDANDKRTAAAVAYHNARKEASKAKSFDLRNWHSECIKASKTALLANPALPADVRDVLANMDDNARKAYKASAASFDPVARVIRAVDAQPARFSEFKRVSLLADAGHPYALGMLTGEYSLNEVLQYLFTESRGETPAEPSAKASGAETGETSIADRFLSTVLKYQKEGLTLADMANIIAERMTTKVSK